LRLHWSSKLRCSVANTRLPQIPVVFCGPVETSRVSSTMQHWSPLLGHQGHSQLQRPEDPPGKILPRPQPWRGADVMKWSLSLDITFEGPEHGGIASTEFSAHARIFVKRPLWCLMLRHTCAGAQVLGELVQRSSTSLQD
jgi:hypothetical protein